jgi:hypothetical protein
MAKTVWSLSFCVITATFWGQFKFLRLARSGDGAVCVKNNAGCGSHVQCGGTDNGKNQEETGKILPSEGVLCAPRPKTYLIYQKGRGAGYYLGPKSSFWETSFAMLRNLLVWPGPSSVVSTTRGDTSFGRSDF